MVICHGLQKWFGIRVRKSTDGLGVISAEDFLRAKSAAEDETLQPPSGEPGVGRGRHSITSGGRYLGGVQEEESGVDTGYDEIEAIQRLARIIRVQEAEE